MIILVVPIRYGKLLSDSDIFGGELKSARVLKSARELKSVRVLIESVVID